MGNADGNCGNEARGPTGELPPAKGDLQGCQVETHSGCGVHSPPSLGRPPDWLPLTGCGGTFQSLGIKSLAASTLTLSDPRPETTIYEG